MFQQTLAKSLAPSDPWADMLYEAIREKGAMIIAPSPVVETMGLGAILVPASIAKQQ